MKQRKVYQKKSLSQVFLKETWPAKKVVEKLKEWDVTRVLEIGPGSGGLTRELIEAGLNITAIEKDGRFTELLKDYFRNIEHFEVIHADALEFSLETWLCDKQGERIAIVGNIPYQISTPLLEWALPWLDQFVGIHFMVQWEFGVRMAAEPGTKDYGSLSVFVQLRSIPSIDQKIPRGCFNPMPKVDSALISLLPVLPEDRLDKELLKKTEVFAKAAFSQRRKKLRNSLRAFNQKEDSATCPIDLERRPETLSPQEFVSLTKWLEK